MRKFMTIGMCCYLLLVLAFPSQVFGLQGKFIPESIFQQLDVPKEKSLSPEAIRDRRVKFFDAIDANSDGLITKEELTVYEMAIFTKLDTNKDNLLTANEVRPEWKGYCARLDTQKDGRVSTDECSAKLEEVFKDMDGPNQDGYITKDEYFIFWAGKDSQFTKDKIRANN